MVAYPRSLTPEEFLALPDEDGLINPDRFWLEAYEGDSVRTYQPGDTLESAHLPGAVLSLDEMFATLDR